MMVHATLLPCPFCGGKADFIQHEAPVEWTIECEDCAATSGFVDNLTDARKAVLIEAWNKRAQAEDGWSKVREIVDLWFAPWGAAKGAMWEDLSGDQPFDPNVALDLIRKALPPAPTTSRSEEAR